MATMDLTGSYRLQGVVYGPGAGIDVPLEGEQLEQLQEMDKLEQEREEQALQLAAMQLPAGHPYHRLFPMVTQQPPEFEGEAVPPATPLSMFTEAELDALSDMLKAREAQKMSESAPVTESFATFGEGGAPTSPSAGPANPASSEATDGDVEIKTTTSPRTPRTPTSGGGTSTSGGGGGGGSSGAGSSD